MAWEKGNQKERVNKTRGINKQLLADDIGFLDQSTDLPPIPHS